MGVVGRTVDLVEVDVVRPSRRRLSSMAWQICLRERPRWLGSSPIGLNTLVATTTARARAEVLERAAEDFLARAERIHVGGVEEVDAGLQRAGG